MTWKQSPDTPTNERVRPVARYRRTDHAQHPDVWSRWWSHRGGPMLRTSAARPINDRGLRGTPWTPLLMTEIATLRCSVRRRPTRGRACRDTAEDVDRGAVLNTFCGACAARSTTSRHPRALPLAHDRSDDHRPGGWSHPPGRSAPRWRSVDSTGSERLRDAVQLPTDAVRGSHVLRRALRRPGGRRQPGQDRPRGWFGG